MALNYQKCFSPGQSAKAGSVTPSSTTKIPTTTTTSNQSYNKFSALEELEEDSQSDSTPTLPPRSSDDWDSAFPDTPLGPLPTISSDEPRFPKASMEKDKERLELDDSFTREPISNTYEIVPSNEHQDKHWNASLSYGDYTLELREKPEGEEQSFPPNAILLFAKEPKKIVHKRGSVYRSFLGKNWRMLLRNKPDTKPTKEGEELEDKPTIRRHLKKRINPLNWGLCLDTRGAVVDPKNAEVFVSKHGKPLGVREALRKTPQEAPPELSDKKPNSWVFKTLPFSNKTYHPTMWEGLTFKDKQDPAYMYAMLKKANQAIVESIETFRNDTWKIAKLREAYANTLMSQEHTRKENEKLKAALAETQTELALFKAEHGSHDIPEFTRERARTYEKNQRKIGTVSEEILKRLSEISPKGANSSVDEFADEFKKLVTMQLEAKWPRKIIAEYQKFEADMSEAKKSITQIVADAGKDVQEHLADARVARIEYRNGLIEGQHLIRTNRKQDEIERHEHLVKTETERLLNNAFLHQYKTDSDNLIAFGERRGFARGFSQGFTLGLATGMNTMSQLENNTYNLSEDDPNHWKTLAIQAGVTATETSISDGAQFYPGGLWHGTNIPGRINSLLPNTNETQPAHLMNFYEYAVRGIDKTPTNPAMTPDPRSEFKLPYYVASLPWQLEYARTVSDAVQDIHNEEKHANQKKPKPTNKPQPKPGPESTSTLGQPNDTHDDSWVDQMQPFMETTALSEPESEAGPSFQSGWGWEECGILGTTDD